MDPFSLCLAFGPLAIYLLLVGAINLSGRPFLVSGSRDMAAMGLAVSGLVMVGPVQLFYPLAASMRYGLLIWVFLVGLYVMVLVLVLLLVRPRLVIYNIFDRRAPSSPGRRGHSARRRGPLGRRRAHAA